jgi:PAP2 superfamily
LRARAASVFPRGPADFVLQLAIWLCFGLLYQIARGIADRDPDEAFRNGRWVISFERHLHSLFELDFQKWSLPHPALVHALDYTYWLSQFAVVGIALLWIYFRRIDHFEHVRNWLIAANLFGLIGYVAVPTAPPRMFAADGFVDTLADSAALNHGTGFVQLAANPYAAMPSLHAADALIIGISMVMLVRNPVGKALWVLWAPWVWFAVMATANHFWLDIAAGVACAGLGYALVTWAEARMPANVVVAGPRRW